MRITKLVFGIIFLSILGWSGWTTEIFGPYDFLTDVKIGDGRNDGVQRVYCSCANGHLIEWTYNGSNWTMTDCGGIDLTVMWCLWIGDGRGDSLNCIYGASADGNVYEYSYSGGAWVMTDLGSPGSNYHGVTIGTPQNDNVSRVVAAGINTPVREYTWNGLSWDTVDVSSGNKFISPMEIGQGRNDGVERIYCPEEFDFYLTEYSWNGSSYDEVQISSPHTLVRAIVGQGRNDGVNRVYVSGAFGHVHEYTYVSGNWQRIDIHPSAPERTRYGLCIGETKNDGRLRLYSVAVGGAIREHSWDGISWSDTIIDQISGATSNIAIGSGKNDDTLRLYVAGSNGYVYEFTNDSAFAVEEIVTKSPEQVVMKIKPNPFLSDVSISYYLPESGQVKLTIYDLLGNEVCVLVDGFQSSGNYTLNFKEQNKTQTIFSKGIYFAHLKTQDFKDTKKAIYLK